MSIRDFTKTLLRLELLAEKPPSGAVGHGKERILKFQILSRATLTQCQHDRVFDDVIKTTSTNDVTDEHHVS